MTNILSDDKRQEVLALGRLGWTLRRIEQATGVRRETASAYLKAAGIESGPLFRARLLSRSEREHVLLLSIHHIVSDFWSVAVLMEELGRMYAAVRDGGAADLAPLELHATDFARSAGSAQGAGGASPSRHVGSSRAAGTGIALSTLMRPHSHAWSIDSGTCLGELQRWPREDGSPKRVFRRRAHRRSDLLEKIKQAAGHPSCR